MDEDELVIASSTLNSAHTSHSSGLTVGSLSSISSSNWRHIPLSSTITNPTMVASSMYISDSTTNASSNYAQISVRDTNCVSFTFTNGNGIKIYADGEFKLQTSDGTKDFNMFELLARLDSLEEKISIILENVPKKITGQVLRDKVNL